VRVLLLTSRVRTRQRAVACVAYYCDVCAEGDRVDSTDAAAVAGHIPRPIASSPVEVGSLTAARCAGYPLATWGVLSRASLRTDTGCAVLACVCAPTCMCVLISSLTVPLVACCGLLCFLLRVVGRFVQRAGLGDGRCEGACARSGRR
jgi:hypothetical protein